MGAGLVKGQAEQYWLRPDFQCDIDEDKWKGSQEEKTFFYMILMCRNENGSYASIFQMLFYIVNGNKRF